MPQSSLLAWLKSRDIEEIANIKAMATCEKVISEMGMEIHDDLVQRLSILRLRIDGLQLAFGSLDPRLHTELQQLQLEFKAVTESVRRVSKHLHPTKHDGDSFEQVVRTMCHDLEGPASSRITVDVVGKPLPLSSEPEIYLIRMIQELIQNSLKHSAAWHLWIRLTWHSDKLIIEVEDDGTGFARLDEFISLLKGRHNTLRMRAKAIGANIVYTKGKAGLLAIITYKI